MAEEAIPLRDMYELTNPDPLRQYSVRVIARTAGCSASTVHQLRIGTRIEVSEKIARALARAVGVDLGDMFRRSGRVAWN